MTIKATYPNLEGCSVFVTGGASGIGASIVQAFAGQGASVGFIDIDVAQGEALANKHRAWFRAQDVCEPDGLKAAVQDFSGPKLDVLVNNVANDTRQAFDVETPEDWRQTMAINLDPVAFTVKAALPALRAAEGASVINMSSINALLGPPDLAAYSTAKAGILGLTKSLARAYGRDKIRVNAILPGWIETERQWQLHLTEERKAAWLEQCALKDSILPEHVSDLVLFLASDASERITGQSFTIDGGRT